MWINDSTGKLRKSFGKVRSKQSFTLTVLAMLECTRCAMLKFALS